MINFNTKFAADDFSDAPSPTGNAKPVHHLTSSVQAGWQDAGNAKPVRHLPQQESVGFAKPIEQNSLSQRQISHNIVTDTHHIRLTPAHFDLITDIFNQLLKKDTYLLALQLGLPDDYRLKLLSGAAADQPSLQQQLRVMAQNSMFSHLHLMVALTRCGRIDLVDLYCHRFGICFDPSQYEDTLYCEDPQQKTYEINKALSLFDLCQIFSGKLDNLGATPVETLAQVMGYRSLLADSELARLVKSDEKLDEKIDEPSYELIDEQSIQKYIDKSIEKTDGKLSIYWLLEKIIQSKGYITAKEAAAILCSPEIGQYNIALRLLAAATDPHLYKVPHDLRKAQHCCEAFQTLNLISALVERRVMIDPERFACALGIPAYRLSLMRPLVVNTTTLMDIILQARKFHYYLAPGHVLHALYQAVPYFDTGQLNAVFHSTNIPLFHQAVVTKAPPVKSPFPLPKDLTKMPESVPLTGTFLSTLPLSHNWVPIGLAMGLNKEDLTQVYVQGKSDPRLLAFYLSEKLIEPHRQLETGDLYHALIELNDQETLDYFLRSQSGQRINPLSESAKQAMKQGLKTAITLYQDDSRDKTLFQKYLQHERIRNSVDY